MPRCLSVLALNNETAGLCLVEKIFQVEAVDSNKETEEARAVHLQQKQEQFIYSISFHPTMANLKSSHFMGHLSNMAVFTTKGCLG